MKKLVAVPGMQRLFVLDFVLLAKAILLWYSENLDLENVYNRNIYYWCDRDIYKVVKESLKSSSQPRLLPALPFCSAHNFFFASSGPVVTVDNQDARNRAAKSRRYNLVQRLCLRRYLCSETIIYFLGRVVKPNNHF